MHETLMFYLWRTFIKSLSKNILQWKINRRPDNHYCKLLNMRDNSISYVWLLFCSVAGARSFIKLLPLDISSGTKAALTYNTHILSCQLQRHSGIPHTHPTLSLTAVVKWLGRSFYCTQPAQKENISFLGNAQTSLYGDTSCLVTTQSAGLFLTFLSFSSQFLWEFFISDLLAREGAEQCFSLAWRVIPPFFLKKKVKKIHKPPSSLFPANLYFGFDVVK